MSPGLPPLHRSLALTYTSATHCFVFPRADRAASCSICIVLFTCCSRHRIICVLRRFSGFLGAVASTDFANSCLPSVHVSEL